MLAESHEARALGRVVPLEVAGAAAEAADDVRALTRPFEPEEVAPGDLRTFVAPLAGRATIDPHAPVTSRHPLVARAKSVVRKATFFVAHHLAVQVSELADAVVAATSATAERVEALEAEQQALRSRLDALERSKGGGGA